MPAVADKPYKPITSLTDACTRTSMYEQCMQVGIVHFFLLTFFAAKIQSNGLIIV